SGAKAAFDTAFSNFMTSNGFASTEEITPAAMKSFIADLETSFNDDSYWQANWSQASDENMQSRISTSETVQSSTNANVGGMRSLALGLVLGQELLTLNLGEQTRKAVTDATIDQVGKAISGIDGERSKLGISEARVKQANTSLNAQVTILSKSIRDMEGIDTY